ncbi:hypothetical protein QUB25_26855 [Microcoleus sp. B3-D7]
MSYVEKVTCSHSTGRLNFFRTGEMRSPATPSHRSPSFPLLKKYSHQQGLNQSRIDRQYAANPLSHQFPSLSHQSNHC